MRAARGHGPQISRILQQFAARIRRRYFGPGRATTRGQGFGPGVDAYRSQEQDRSGFWNAGCSPAAGSTSPSGGKFVLDFRANLGAERHLAEATKPAGLWGALLETSTGRGDRSL